MEHLWKKVNELKHLIVLIKREWTIILSCTHAWFYRAPNIDLPVLGDSKNKLNRVNWKSISPIEIPERKGDWGPCTGQKNSIFRSSAGRLIAVFPTKKAGKIGATTLRPTFESDSRETKLVAVCNIKTKTKTHDVPAAKNCLILKMQVSDLGSPVSPQNLLAEHRQSSPEIDKLIQKAGEFNI